jgi:hypothetical protein
VPPDAVPVVAEVTGVVVDADSVVAVVMVVPKYKKSI